MSPPCGVIKINFDGAVSDCGEWFGLGFVARDHQGHFVMAGSKRVCAFEGCAEVAEIRALRWAMQAIHEQHGEQVTFEGDCLNIIEAVSGRRRHSFHVQTRVNNCIQFSRAFSSCNFFFCFRECNSVAHRIARWALLTLSDEM